MTARVAKLELSEDQDDSVSQEVIEQINLIKKLTRIGKLQRRQEKVTCSVAILIVLFVNEQTDPTFARLLDLSLKLMVGRQDVLRFSEFIGFRVFL